MTLALLATHRAPADRRTPPGARRAGYTLFELVVVLALIVVVSSLSVPYFQSMMAGARIDAAGDMVRGRLADTRSMALEQGKAFRFGFLPGTGKFMIAPDDSTLWDAVQDDGEIEQEDLLRGQLPESVVFVTDPKGLDGGSPPSAGNAWQLGGVFLPDGTAHGAANPDGTSVDDVTFYFGQPSYPTMGVCLRGLTASVRVFDPAAEGDQP